MVFRPMLEALSPRSGVEAMDLDPSGKGRKGEEAAKPSFFRRNWRRAKFVAGGPVASVGVKDISDGARLIDNLLAMLRSGPQADVRLKTNEDRSIDLAATAFLYGISVVELERRLRSRQAQTSRAAYAMFGLGSLSLLLWLYGALQMRMSSARLLSAIEFLPFCTAFFLLAFKSAWMNWQIRTRRLASAGAFLRTTEPFLPR
jgi:hypothetical protein